MAGYLTTDMPDMTCGRPAVGLGGTLWRIEESGSRRGRAIRTNGDGRTHDPIPPAAASAEGLYDHVCGVGARLRSTGQSNAFLKAAPIRFRGSAPKRRHAPPLSPFGFSTCRRR